MNEIKFSHRYNKMPSDMEMTFLFETFRKFRSELSSFFLEYDTSYPGGRYPLKDGELIILLLLSRVNGKDVIWTTVRSFNPAKWAYYQQMRGHQVNIIIEGE